MKIRFVAFNGLSWTSKAIRFVTRSKKYSHVGYVTDTEEWDVPTLIKMLKEHIEAIKLVECWQTPGNFFQAWTVSGFKNHTPGTSFEIWELDIGDQEAFDKVDDFFYNILGTKYDWLGVIGFVFKRIKGAATRIFCSEGCITPIIEPKGLTETIPEHVGPKSFIGLIQACGAKKVYQGQV